MKRPNTIPAHLKWLAYEEAEHRCAWCGSDTDLTVAHIDGWPIICDRLRREGWPERWQDVYEDAFHQSSNATALCRRSGPGRPNTGCHVDYDERGAIARNDLVRRKAELSRRAAARGVYHQYIWTLLAKNRPAPRVSYDYRHLESGDDLGRTLLLLKNSFDRSELPEPYAFIAVADHRPCNAWHEHVDLRTTRVDPCSDAIDICREATPLWSPWLAEAGLSN